MSRSVVPFFSVSALTHERKCCGEQAGKNTSRFMFKAASLVVILGSALILSSCLVMAYSNRGGWRVWPGGLILLGILLVFWLWRARGR
jgi:uncharacterized integral membrane protein